MVVCKFFLQGTCKFGDFCKFEHQLNDNFSNYQNSTSILRQSQFGNTQQQQPKPATNPTNVDTNTLVKSVVNDMISTEKGGQWLLSCYGPFKEKPGFPGFEDHSFEEIRLGYYEAVKNGTLEQYKQQIQMLLQQAAMRVKSLQSPSPDVVNLLKSIYNTPVPPQGGVQVQGANTPAVTPAFAQLNQNIFGKPQPQTQFSGTSSSIFGGSSPQNQIFGGQPRNNPIFGNIPAQPQSHNANIFQQTNNVFGAQPSSSIFGGQPATSQANTTSSIFGAGQSTGGSIFGGQQMSSSLIIGGQQKVTPSFGGPPQMSSGGSNIFNSTFAAPLNTSSTFNQTAQSIFGVSSNMSNPAFGTLAQQNVPQAPSTNIFRMQSSQPQADVAPSMFNQQPPPLNNQSNISNPVFNQQAQPGVIDVKSYSNSIFGGNQTNFGVSSTMFGQVQQVDKTVYSLLEELTEDDFKWFESDDLDVLNMPEKPPTYEMCFKT